MANTGALVIKYIGDTRDIAKSNKSVAREMGKFKSTVAKANQAANAGLVAGGAAAVKFGIDSVKAYTEAETAQNKLTASYKKFPKMADVPLSKLKELNSTLAKKTKFDDDATASGQAVLAQFGLTGKQIAKLTPLLQDYAARTGKDLPTAAKDLGKSVMGQGRALKNIGLNFEDTGSKADNLKQLIGGLREKVGGFASKEGKTAAGRSEILKNQFGELQETVGGALMPTLQRLVGVLLTVVGWIDRNRGATIAIAGSIVGLMVTVKAITFAMKAWVAVTKICNALLLGTRLQLIGLAVVQKTVAVATKIGAAAQWLFNAALRANPIGIVITAVTALVAGLVWFFTKTKVGQAIVRAAWAAIQAAIKGVADWWTKTAWPAIKGALKSMGDWFRSVGRGVGRSFRWMGDALGSVWGWIKKNVIDRFVLGVKVWALIFKIVGRRVGNLFGNMRDRLASVGFWIRKNVFNRIGSALDAMKDAFRSAKDSIGKIWDGLKKKAAVPVNFVIDAVYNNGIRKAINALPGTQGLKEVPKIRFARGGGVFGGIPGRDSVNSLLMPGEHVLTAKEVQKLGGQGAVYKMRKAIRSGEFNGLGDLPAFAKGGGFSGERIAQTQAFAKRQAGKPYGWGAVGPSAYDCSGFMSALTNVLQGQSPHRRRGATADFPWPGFKRGIGQFTVGSSRNFSNGIGHMAGNLAGMGVESRGGRGVILGSGAMSTSRFDGQYHLGASGAAAAKSGTFWDAIQSVVGIFNQVKGWFTSLSKMGDWSKIVKQVVREVAKEAGGFINKTIPGPGPLPTKFASGGFVKRRPGGVHAIIGEGRYDEVVAQVRPGGGPAGGGDRWVHVDLSGDPLGRLFMDIIRKQVKKKFGGNVQIALGG